MRKKEMGDKTNLIFSYGTLKQGFANHTLIQDLIHTGDASFVGMYKTMSPYPLVCGPYRVPFLLNFPDKGKQVYGELYAVTPLGLAKMDVLEGVSKGHYERLPLRVVKEDENGNIKEVEAYYGHRNYAEEMWKRNGMIGHDVYSKTVAEGYVKRMDRPRDTTFLDQIRSFLSSTPSL
ncbi:Gamma-glutamylaminecyclotransferase A [Zostera marina]|uniref:Gamma-glutamylcyclotransferase family protein n=1 Tax=Zostera marina TaxID=29655 RepID=A0A0K9PBW7_ZOSMR|nr:Gamma-glutamylaminecyclotransferase A [Zostera marina]